ncbi:MAG: SRPBCC family protein [Devosia sp.]
MAIKIEEIFVIDAPVDEVWAFISDPTKVVTCLPGAELVKVVDDKTYEGKVKVKVGPIVAQYKGVARIEELDAVARTIRVVGEGKEMAGAGLAKAGMVGAVEATPEGGARVSVNADVDIKGKLAQFGGGLIQEVARQIFKQFADNVQLALAVPAGAAQPDASRQTSVVATDAAAVEAAYAAPPPRPAPNSSNVDALPLIFKSLGALVSRFFGRLFGTAR